MNTFPQISKNMVARIAMLKQKKHRVQENLFVVEGTKSVADLCNHFVLRWLLIEKNYHPDFVIPKEGGCYVCAEADMKKMSSLSTPPQIIAVFQIPTYSLNKELLATNLTLLADGIQDPGNLGTMIRTADWFGVHQVICSHKCADIWNAKTIQATMGALARVKVFYHDLPTLVAHNPSIPVCGLLLDGKNIYHANLPQCAFVVMGNEGKGVSKEMRALLTNAYLIPSFPPNQPTGESLNVAAATAITLAEFRRQINAQNETPKPKMA